MNFHHDINNIKIDLDKLKIEDILFKRELNIKACPYCNNSSYIRHGYYNNIQRFKCTNIICRKTFSSTTKSPLSYTKKSYTLWKEYFKLMLENKTLCECSEILKINLTTSFYWRHKILATMKTYIKTDPLQEFLEINKLSFKENFKGSKNITTKIRNPIWIISAVDINKTIISDIISIGPISVHIIKSSIYNKIPKNAYMLPSTDSHLKALAKIHNKNLTTHHPKDKELVRSFSKFIHPWFFRFKGIATKYLNSYLTWYILFYKNYSNNNNINDNQNNDNNCMIKNDYVTFLESLTLENSFTRYKDFKTYEISFG